MHVSVHCNGQVVKIKGVVLNRLYGHPVHILTQQELDRCLRLQALYRSLKGKRTSTDGYKPKELRVLAKH
jgi:hypothetical protein